MLIFKHFGTGQKLTILELLYKAKEDEVKLILKVLKVNSGLINEPTNCYIVQDEQTKETMVIDPGGEAEKIIEMLNILQAKVKYIYLTHCHGDHIGALKELKNQKGGKILIHRFDAEGLYNKDISLTDYIGIEEIHLEADSRVDDQDVIHLGKLEFKVIHTPGHTARWKLIILRKRKFTFFRRYAISWNLGKNRPSN